MYSDLKLRRITIENFKALGHVDVPIRDDLLFLIGTNGAGKSSILQALSLIRYFAEGMTTSFFKDRGWKPTDARPKTIQLLPLQRAGTGSKQTRPRNLGISLAFESDEFELFWSFQWSYSSERTIRESVWVREHNSDMPRRIVGYPAAPNDKSAIADLLRLGHLKLPGSLLSLFGAESFSLSDEDAKSLESLSNWATGITSLELLNPSTMRNRLRGEGNDIGPQGERLATFLAELKPDSKERVVHRIRDFYPIKDLDTTRKRAGWIDMQVAEAFRMMGRVDATHMSDGFLRILALCAIPEFGPEASLVLLDEVEDGIEPHILPPLIERIAEESSSQLLMTSHSPLLINFFEQSQIFLLSRDKNGQTVGAEVSKLKPFQQGGKYLGTGEIWANVSFDSVYESLPRSHAPRRPISEAIAAEDILQFLQSR